MTETFEERFRRLWPHFIHSFALADDLGEAADDVRRFAELMSVPMPDHAAEFSGCKDSTEETWVSWAREQAGAAGDNAPIGIWSNATKLKEHS